ncbi:unnamed protein product [Spirodela intermedia]|uniref:Uncharacterized protein n=2 Tax=Spirodela intermedia TaxID=51605 RepID=A0A7I8JQE9_SPIIN|nr:unnamed protein product [Spirodela intermedia]CAA6672397.1 unnamed protein product [Spirodela intermedia]CAA7409580.1 unnamed protein product [Spirodela intermedia]
MAASKAAMVSASKHKVSLNIGQQTLYAAKRALGDPPLAVPFPNPKRLAPGANAPPAMERV